MADPAIASTPCCRQKPDLQLGATLDLMVTCRLPDKDSCRADTAGHEIIIVLIVVSCRVGCGLHWRLQDVGRALRRLAWRPASFRRCW